MKINKQYLIGCAALVFAFSGCAGQDEQSLQSEKEVAEIFKDRPKSSAIEDPEPELEIPDFEKELGGTYNMRLLDEIIKEGQVPSELLKAIQEHIRNVDPEIKKEFSNINLEFLLGILDPRVPLDPTLEATLKQLLEAEKEKLLLIDIPELAEWNAPDGKPSDKDDAEISFTEGEDSDCALEVYNLYGSGARSCGLDRQDALEMIESNYLSRSFEAEERFEERNEWVDLDQLPLVVNQFRKVLATVKEAVTPEEVVQIRSSIGYLAATYAYYLRINSSLWQEYGLKLSEWYYLKELQLIEEHRLSREEEVEELFTDCIDWVNGLIVKEVDRKCPGDEPILY